MTVPRQARFPAQVTLMLDMLSEAHSSTRGETAAHV